MARFASLSYMAGRSPSVREVIRRALRYERVLTLQ
jgi:hypothetical protein